MGRSKHSSATKLRIATCKQTPEGCDGHRAGRERTGRRRWGKIAGMGFSCTLNFIRTSFLWNLFWSCSVISSLSAVNDTSLYFHGLPPKPRAAGQLLSSDKPVWSNLCSVFGFAFFCGFTHWVHPVLPEWKVSILPVAWALPTCGRIYHMN